MLGLQEEEQGLYLVAWSEDVPVGMAFVAWGLGAVSSHARREESAELRTIEALEGHRRQGIGTALLGLAEQAVAEQGVQKLGIQVGLDNVNAKSFYEHIGYVDAGHGLFTEEVISENEQGLSGVCQFLIKELIK